MPHNPKSKIENPKSADRLVSAALIGASLLLVGFTIWLQWFWADHSLDIDVYWEAGERMWLGGADLYAEPDDGVNRVGLFIYPPFFACLFAPITLFPRWAGYALWGMIELALVAAGFRAIRGLCGVNGPANSRAFYLLMAIGVSGAVWTNLQEGQVNMLVLSALAAGLWQLERKREVSGGLLLAAATHLKVIPIVLLPLLIAQKRFKAAGMMAAGIAVLWLTPLLFTIPNLGLIDGIEANVDLSRSYVDSIASPRLENQDAANLGGARAPNNALSAVVQRWFDDDHRLSLNEDDRSPLATTLPKGVVKWAGLCIGAILGGLAMLLAWRRRESHLARTAAIGLGLLAAALANLLFWPHHLCLVLLVLGPLAASCSKPALAAVGIILTLCFVPLMDRIEVFDWMAILGTPTLGVLLVWGLTFIHFWRGGKAPPILPAERATHEETPTGNPAA
jgi:alpha-1,2-mannosyltransferase